MHSWITALVLSLLAAGAGAKEPPKPLNSLRAELLAQIKSLATQKNPEGNAWDPDLNRLFFLLMEESDGDLSDEILLDTLDRTQKESPSKELRDLCGKFAQAIQRQAARESEEFEKRLHAAVRNALEKGLAATSAQGVDAPLADLAILSEEAMRFEGRRAVSSGKQLKAPVSEILQATTFVLSTYQDGLLAKPDRAPLLRQSNPSQDLKSWMSNNLERVIPRDLMSHDQLREKLRAALARISSGGVRSLNQEEYQERLLELVGTAAKLEDLDDVFARIDALKSRQNRGDTTEVMMLRGYYDIYRGLRSGTVTALRMNDTTSPVDSNPTLVTIKRQLTRYGLAQVLKSSPALPQKENESTEDFLRRVLTVACAAHDWQMIPRVSQVSSNLRLNHFLDSSDWVGFSFVLRGVNMERAGVPAEAASSYLAALRIGSPLVPAEYLRDRLKTIRQQFPDAFEGAIPEGPTAPKEEH